jgi:Flp pilus assembly protein TadG
MRSLRRFFPHALSARIEQLYRNARGNVAVTFAVAAFPAMVMVGAGIDYSTIVGQQSKLQSAVDSAALALAPTAAQLSASDVSSQAQQIVTAALADTSTTNLNVTASYDASSLHTTVSATTDATLSMMSLVGVNRTTISRSATAMAGQTATTTTTSTAKVWPVCLMVTSPSAVHSLFASGTDATHGSSIALNNCMLQVNTASWDAVETDQPSASIIGNNSEFCFHGGYVHNVATHGTVTTTVNGATPNNYYGAPPSGATDVQSNGVWDSGCAVFADPLANMTSPLASAACTFSGSKSISTPTTLNPGRYCGNITVSGTNGKLTLNPGFYQIDGYITSSLSGSSITGNGVTLYLNGSNAFLHLVHSTMNISAPTDSSPFAGIALYVNNTSAQANCVVADANPNNTPASSCMNYANNSSNVTLSGLAYARYMYFDITTSSNMTITNGGLIADYVGTRDTSTLSITGAANAATAAQLSMMQASQGGYTTSTTTTSSTNQPPQLVQ